MGSIALSIVGIIAAMAIAIIFVYKGYSVLLLGPIAAFIIALTSGINFAKFSDAYATSYGNTLKSLVIIYLSAMIFAELLKQTGAATSIAYWVADTVGAKHTATFALIATTVLAIGGMSLSSYFVVYPIGLILCSKANYNKGFLAAACLAGSWSFAIVTPFMPSIHNALLTSLFGVDGRTAGMIPGLIGGVFMLVFDIVYLEWLANRTTKQGKTFDSWDLIPKDSEETRGDLPPVWRSMIPIILVLVLYNGFGLPITTSLFTSCIFITIFEFKRLKKKGWFRVWEDGAKGCIVPTACVAAMTGIGGIISATPAYSALFDMIKTSTLHPYIIIFIASQLIGFSLGSGSGGITTTATALSSVYKNYAAMGFDMGNMARITAVGACGLSAGPHSGGFSGVFAAFKTNHKESYFPIFITCVCGGVVAGVIEVALMIAGL